jgi:lipopolysaccharide heptosyltransferase II
LKQNPKILIIQTAYLGDVILTLPVVQNIKKQLPEAEIDFLCIPQTAEALKNNPAIRNLVVYDKRGKNKASKLKNIISQVRETKYNIVLSPHRSFRSALITHLSGAEIRIGFNKNSLSYLLTHSVPYVKNIHEILRNLELVKAIPGITLTAENQILKPELFPSKLDIEYVENFLNSLHSIHSMDSTHFISLAPCSKWFTKQLTKNKSVEIIDRLTYSGFKVILIGGSEDTAYCNEIEMAVSGPNLLNLCGRLLPLQSKVMIEKSDCLVSVDSAAAHIGASAGVPVVQIYGSTVPAFGFYPLTSKNVIIENNSLPCRPCTNHGRNSCPLKHFKCIEELDANKIAEAVENLVSNEI